MNIKPELQKEYDEYVKKNNDPYGKCAVDAGESVMRLLDEGKTPEEAEKGLYEHDLTGFLAGCAAQAIFHFHVRGEEFNKFWNKNNGGSGEEKGTINPAIITLK